MFKRRHPEVINLEYVLIETLEPGVVQCPDHLGGFDQYGCNQVFDQLLPSEIHVEYVLPEWVKQKYSKHVIKFDAEMMIKENHFEKAISYDNIDQQRVFDNFLCCFNRSDHMARQRLTEELFRKGWFTPEYCSKFFQNVSQRFDAEIHNFRKVTFGHGTNIDKSDVISNLTQLSPLIKSSFINLVSETMPDNYMVFPTEKFLFPILNKRLWLAYAAPGYHKFLSEKLGFQLYDDFFDYSFDEIHDPQARLSALVESLASFSKLTKKAWENIYKVLEPAIEHNYQWAKSGQFIDRLRALDEVTKPMSIAESV